MRSFHAIDGSPRTPWPARRLAARTVSAPDTNTFLGSQPRRAHVPPKGRKSTIATLRPACRTREATPEAAAPLPTTTRSYRLPIAHASDSKLKAHSALSVNQAAAKIEQRRGENAQHKRCRRIDADHEARPERPQSRGQTVGRRIEVHELNDT